MAKAKSPKRYPEAEHAYEKSGKRPGTPVGTRLSEPELKLLDAKLAEGQSRSAWVKDLILSAIGSNKAPARRTRKRC